MENVSLDNTEQIYLDTALRWMGPDTWVKVYVDGYPHGLLGVVDKDSGPETTKFLEFVKERTGHEHLWVYMMEHMNGMDRGIVMWCKGMVE